MLQSIAAASIMSSHTGPCTTMKGLSAAMVPAASAPPAPANDRATAATDHTSNTTTGRCTKRCSDGGNADSPAAR